MQFNFGNLPAVLQEAFQTQTITDLSGGKHPLNSNVTRREAVRLYALVRTLRPRATAEIGFAQGVSTLAILKALEDNQCGTHHVIDPFQSECWGNLGLQMVEKARLGGRLDFREEFSERAIPELPTVDFGFIDSSHLFDLTLVDFVLIDKILSVGGVVGMHDLWMPSLRSVYSYILSNRAFKPYYDTTQRERLKHLVTSALIKFLPMSGPRKRSLYVDVAVLDMVFLQKVGEDKRDWRFHRSFQTR